MNFLYPSFFFALAAIAIPVIIHLFNFRRYKTVYFSNVKYLRSVKQQTRSRSQLKHLLILLCRVLAITALVFAFTQPYIPLAEKTDTGKTNTVGIYIDNSFSMDAESKYGKLIEVAKNKAREITDAYPVNTKYLFLTNDFELKHQHLVNKEQIADYLEDVETSPDFKKLSSVWEKQADLLNTDNDSADNNITIFMISDFQKTSADPENLKNDTSIKTILMPLATQPTNNLYIDSCWFESPVRKYEQPEELYVSISNHSDESYHDIPVKLYLNDSLKALAGFNIEGWSSETVVLSYNNTQKGIIHGKINIEDYPVTYDNTFYFSYVISDRIGLLIISEDQQSKYLNALFSEDPYINTTYEYRDNIKSSLFSNYHTIILNHIKDISSGLAHDLTNYVNNGGVLLLLPDPEGNISSYNALLSPLTISYSEKPDTSGTRIKAISTDDELYKNVFMKVAEDADLPVIHSHMVIKKLQRSGAVDLLTTRNNHTILCKIPSGKGQIFVSAIPLSEEYSNFPNHPVFVPTLYNIVLNSQPSDQIYYTIGKDKILEVSNKYLSDYNIFHIKDRTGAFDMIPKYSTNVGGTNIRLEIQEDIDEAGNYILLNNDIPVSGIAYNFNRNESDLSYYTAENISELITDMDMKNFSLINTNTRFLDKTLTEIQKGRQLWKLFIILTLLFILAEISLLRLWK